MGAMAGGEFRKWRSTPKKNRRAATTDATRQSGKTKVRVARGDVTPQIARAWLTTFTTGQWMR